MPQSGDLPDDLKSLVRRNAIEISHTRFRTDSERLIVAVEQALEETTAKRLEREAMERLEVERPMVHDLRLPPPDRVAPTVPVTPPTFPGKRKLRTVAGIMTLLALVIGLAVGAAIYFGSPRPSSKPTTSEPMAQPSFSASTPSTVIIPSPSPKPTIPKVAVQPSAKPTAPVTAMTLAAELTKHDVWESLLFYDTYKFRPNGTYYRGLESGTYSVQGDRLVLKPDKGAEKSLSWRLEPRAIFSVLYLTYPNGTKQSYYAQSS